MVRNDDKVWDEETVRYFYEHQNIYNVGELSGESLEKFIENLLYEHRLKYDDDSFFDIQVGEIIVGELWTDTHNEEFGRAREISIRIFDEYCRNGYAKKALKYYIENNRNSEEYLMAIVRPENPNIKLVEQILKRSTFKNNLGTDEWYYPDVPDLDTKLFTPSAC